MAGSIQLIIITPNQSMAVTDNLFPAAMSCKQRRYINCNGINGNVRPTREGWGFTQKRKSDILDGNNTVLRK